jgi:hypothetical protein
LFSEKFSSSSRLARAKYLTASFEDRRNAHVAEAAGVCDPNALALFEGNRGK